MALKNGSTGSGRISATNGKPFPRPLGRDEGKQPGPAGPVHERGHGMARNREPRQNAGLPHEGEREKSQPYSGEVEDYSGGSVTRTPEDQTDGGSDDSHRG